MTILKNSFFCKIAVISFFIFNFFFYPSQVLGFNSKVYVANSGNSSVSILNSNSYSIDAFSVELTPRSVVSHGQYVYIANQDSRSISVVDTTVDAVIDTILLMSAPFSLELNNDGTRLYVSYNGNDNNHTVSVIDTTTRNIVNTLNGFSTPQGMLVTNDNNRLYVVSTNCCSDQSSFLSVVDLITENVINVPLKLISTNIVLSSNEKEAYITNNGGNTQGEGVDVINLETNTIVKNISVGENPYGIVINSTGNKIYVSNTFYVSGGDGTVSVIDTATDSVVATIPVGNTPNFLAISPDDKRVYVANTGSDSVSVIDTATNTVINTIPVGDGPWGITVVEVPPQLTVHYFSQNELPWGPTEYDSTKDLGTFAETMDRWGCAITSIAMVMKYQHFDKLPNGTSLDPGSLNQWLKSNNGYIKGIGPSGWYSFLDWSRIGSLSKKIYDAGLSEKKLEWKRLAATKQNLENELDSDRPPVIQVRNAATSMHFSVATGVKNNTFAINDPEWEYPDLTSFNNTFYQLDTFIPSQTNLSYLTLFINPEVEMLITDALGRKTGKQVINGVTQAYQEIPDAFYGYEGPIDNPDSNGKSESLGTGGNIFLLPKPTDGGYTLTLSSAKNTFYTLNLSMTKEDGENNLAQQQGSLSADSVETMTINYSQSELGTVEKKVTFQTMLEDIKELYALDKLHISRSLSLTALIKDAEKAYNKGDKRHAEKLLSLTHKQIEKSGETHIDMIAKKILLSDSASLKKLITN